MENPRTQESQLELLPDHGQHFTLEHFRNLCREHRISDEDGIGYYATATEISRQEANPLWVEDETVDAKFTHVVWFDK